MQVEYDKVEDAVEQVRLGKAWAAIYLGENFTTDLMERVCSVYGRCPFNFGKNISNQTINGSAVHIYSDVTSEQMHSVRLCSFCSLFVHRSSDFCCY